MTETQVISARVAPDIKRKLEELAQNEMRTVSNMLAKIIMDYPMAKPTRKPSKANQDIEQTATEILDYLNDKTGRHKATQKFTNNAMIKARLRDKKNPATLYQCKLVIDYKCREWMGGRFEEYLRPSTLFNTKFYEYLAAAERMSEQQEQYENWLYEE